MTDYRNTVLYGHVNDSLRTLIDAGVKVNMVCTSPPYWNLRSYLPDDHPDKRYELGKEPTPESYVENMVEVFRLVRELLAEDGTLWVNVGDKYAGSGSPGGDYNPGGKREGQRRATYAKLSGSLKRKDLCMIPAQLAIALRNDGWWLRSEIVWHKPAVLPESVQDRPVRDHEMIYMFSKNEKYFYDPYAVQEAASPDTYARYARGRSQQHKYADGGPGGQTIARTMDHMLPPGVNPKAVEPGFGIRANESFSAAVKDVVGYRNLRTVWSINTGQYKGAHFATFPERIPEIAILAGTSEHGHCPICHRGYKRIITKSAPLTEQQRACGADSQGGYHGQATKEHEAHRAQNASETKKRILEGMRERTTTGWEPGCRCDAREPVRGIVLDPFLGSGTTALVAERLGRHWIGCELNEEYRVLIEQRTAQRGLFA